VPRDRAKTDDMPTSAKVMRNPDQKIPRLSITVIIGVLRVM
jgi:hypothetical protein